MKYYCDLVAKRNVGVPPYVSLGFVVRAIHSYLSDSSQPSVLISFPRAVYGEGANPGNKVRVFAASREDVEGVLNHISKDKRFHDIVVAERIKPVPEEVETFECVSRVRIPSRNKKEMYEGQKELLLKRRMEIASRLRKLPSVPMQSKSSGSSYSFGFDSVKKSISSKEAEEANKSGKADGYGLSHPSAPLWVPYIQ